MSNSTHKVEVFRVERLDKHPNADRLEIMTIFDAYKCIVRSGDFKVGDLAAFIPPDNVVPDTEQFAFLKGHLRIKAQKLRGIVSQGLVIAAPEGTKEGDDIAESMGITHYVPADYSRRQSQGAILSKQNNPPITGSVYDIDSWYKYARLIEDGEWVEISEKLHGSSWRGSVQGGRLYVGSRNFWRRRERKNFGKTARFINRLTFGRYMKEKPETCVYWRIIDENQWIEKFLLANPGLILYGEMYGWVQDLRYGANPGQVWFRMFDLYDTATQRWIPAKERWAILSASRMQPFLEDPSVPSPDYHVPILYNGPYSREVMECHINGPSTIPGAKHCREGVVVKLWDKERTDDRIGRVILKAVSPEYLERGK